MENAGAVADPWPTFHDLLVAYKSCRLKKRISVSQARFETRLSENLAALHHEVHADRYKPAPAKCFIVTHPKPREIFASDFRDRVVHHLVVGQLEPVWERKFIHASFACRVGRGSHGAIKHMQQVVRSLSRGGVHPVWALQLDLEKFFVSINRQILCGLLLQHAHHPRLRALIQAIYRHDARVGAKRSGSPALFHLIPPGKSWFDQELEQGIPIGNLTSQFGANVYLTALDHFVQRNLKPAAYMRYMDDLVLLDTDPAKLKTMATPIDCWLRENRRQRLNPAKTSLTCLFDEISYLGYRLQQTDTPEEPLQVFAEPKKKWRVIEAFRGIENRPIPAPEKPHPLAPHLVNPRILSTVASCNARIGTLTHAKTYTFRKQTLEQLVQTTRQPLAVSRELHDSWSPFKIKKDYRAIQLK